MLHDYGQSEKGADPECVGRLLEEAYAAAPFVRLLGRNQPADTKNVTRTNCVDIGWAYDPRTNRVILMSAEDNVVKGAGARPFSPSISCAGSMKRKACGSCSFLIRWKALQDDE
ncbi:MAG: hypothetical protein ACLT38_00090 [Akkermansia sp.]